MNKTEVIAEVSRMTNISVSDCEKVLDAFEEVLGGELNRKGWKNGISEMIFKIMGKIKGKKGVIVIYIFLFIFNFPHIIVNSFISLIYIYTNSV